ncbi:unnamed protein product [Rotaria socialis]|uniref:Uncharacterized protein n=1 Tax=Rotaria socialis TaxID=392032 RepID=A0A820YNU0_9BILA|nr:unnamed protein product [Rotaria socialis]
MEMNADQISLYLSYWYILRNAVYDVSSRFVIVMDERSPCHNEKNVGSISLSEQMTAQTADNSDEQQAPNDKTTTSADISKENDTNLQ